MLSIRPSAAPSLTVAPHVTICVVGDGLALRLRITECSKLSNAAESFLSVCSAAPCKSKPNIGIVFTPTIVSCITTTAGEPQIVPRIVCQGDTATCGSGGAVGSVVRCPFKLGRTVLSCDPSDAPLVVH